MMTKACTRRQEDARVPGQSEGQRSRGSRIENRGGHVIFVQAKWKEQDSLEAKARASVNDLSSTCDRHVQSCLLVDNTYS